MFVSLNSDKLIMTFNDLIANMNELKRQTRTFCVLFSFFLSVDKFKLVQVVEDVESGFTYSHSM